jgi:response regulator RpfG family c-di-GMP phosphodiesterase
MDNLKPILFVDDDANALAGFQRSLHTQFTIDVAQGAPRGLQTLTTRGPFSVVISDMRMPMMNGIQFLQRAREIAPDTVRVMLTGNADLPTAIDAVNEGSIFQFLCKPIPPVQLAKAITAAAEHHALICSERDLREKTLRGSVKVLTEVLSLVNPPAFGRAMRMADIVRTLAAVVAPRDAWQFELAALLSQLGCVTLPPALLEAVGSAVPLGIDDRRRYEAHPGVARDLIVNIPRLGDVAEMIARQHESHGAGVPETPPADTVTLGARLLRIAFDLDALVSTGLTEDDAVSRLEAKQDEYDPRLLLVLSRKQEPPPDLSRQPVRIPLADVQVGMEVLEDIRTGTGLLLINRGTTVTPALRHRLGNFLRLNAIFGTVRVQPPARGDRPAVDR